jgi:hypothetical protein
MSTLNRFAGTRNGIEVMASKLDILELGVEYINWMVEGPIMMSTYEGKIWRNCC